MKRKLLSLFVGLMMVILSFPAVMPSVAAFDVTVTDDFHDTRGIESSTNIVVGGGEAKLLANIEWMSNPIISGLVSVGERSAPTVFEMGGIWYLISGNFDGTFRGFRWVDAEKRWVPDTAIVSGLEDVGFRSTPTVFEMGGIWWLISGNFDGTFTGFRWMAAEEKWEPYPIIVSGLEGGVGEFSTPTVFKINGIWYLISGNRLGTFTGFRWTGVRWVSNTAIVDGLVSVGGQSTPTVFEMGGIWYLISGNWAGTFTGFRWTDTRWEPDPIASGLIDVGWISTPTVFKMDEIWYLISGKEDGIFIGFNWTGAEWVSNPIVSGLVSVGESSAPTVFNMNGTWYLISGRAAGDFTGFRREGARWVSNTAIVDGLGGVGLYSTPTVFEMGGTWYLISGNRLGTFTGFRRVDARWVSNTAIVDGLGGVGEWSTPTVFEMGGIWYLISGNHLGTFTGFRRVDARWVSHPAIVDGLGGVGFHSTPIVFEMGGIWYLISGDWDGIFTGFKREGTGWVSYPAIVSGLFRVGDYSAPTAFEMGEILYLISGNDTGAFTGFNCTGTGTLTSITSTTARQIVSITATITDTTPVGTTLIYHVSVDNGTIWERITNGQTLTVTGIGSEFKWKADLSTADPLATPIIKRVSFGITIQSPPPPPTPPDRFFSCFIATAAFGTPMAEEVVVLSRFRDRYLLTNELGRRFVSLYYRHSPAIAEYISEREWAKRIVRITLLPLVRIAEFIVGEESRE